jgi:Flp pilus assembly protein TadG
MAVEEYFIRLLKLIVRRYQTITREKSWRLRKEYSPPLRLYSMTENRTLPAAVESREENRSGFRKRRQRGSEILEFTLVLLPMLGFVFLILDIAWAVYTRSTLQYAVAQGVRYAVTSQTTGTMGQRASIQTAVQQNAFGRLGATAGAATGVNGWNNIYVDWYLVNADGSLTNEDGVVGGNGMTSSGQFPLVEVSVQNISSKTFLPTIKMPGLGTILNPIAMTTVAWDRMESPPLTGIPAQ